MAEQSAALAPIPRSPRNQVKLDPLCDPPEADDLFVKVDTKDVQRMKTRTADLREQRRRIKDVMVTEREGTKDMPRSNSGIPMMTPKGEDNKEVSLPASQKQILWARPDQDYTEADARPDRIVINFFPLTNTKKTKDYGTFLRERWGFTSTKPPRSQVMETTLQSADRDARSELARIRVLLGIPPDNQCYKFVFVYPSTTPNSSFCGGFVYFNGPWRGLCPATTIIGANMLTYSSGYVKNSFYAMNLVRVDCGLLFCESMEDLAEKGQMSEADVEQLRIFETHTLEAVTVEGKPTFGPIGNVSAFTDWKKWATDMAWILPKHAQGLSRDIDKAVIAGQSGSFLFLNSRADRLGRKYSLYAMVVRQLLVHDPPHRALGTMPHRQARRFAMRYLKGKKTSPKEKKPRLLVLLGGSGAGKSTLLSHMSKLTNGYVDPDHPNWVLSGLDEFIEFVPEYVYAVKDMTLGYTNAASYSYGAAIQIAIAVNLECMSKHINMIYEDTGKDLARTVAVIKEMGKGRNVTVVILDTDVEIALSRAQGRFQITGRFASQEYIRQTFHNVFKHYLEMRRLANCGEIIVDQFIYANNNKSGLAPNIWLDDGPNAYPIVPPEAYSPPPVKYRPHFFMLSKMLKDQEMEKKYSQCIQAACGKGSREFPDDD